MYVNQPFTPLSAPPAHPVPLQLGDPRSGSIRLPKGTTQDYDTIRQQCLSQNALFEDRIFAPKSLRQGDCLWLRPYEISSSPKFFSEGVSRFDVVQGELGDCWLVAAVANLTLNRRLFGLVVPGDQSFERGTYCGIFRFRFWQFGKWVEVVIDDRLPTRNGKLVFMHSSDPDEFWSSLLEKAYAKLHGSYESLRGGTTCEAMVDMTGGVTEFFDIQTPEAPSDLFNIMRKGFERGSLVGASIEAKDDSEREDHLPNGLIKGHAYSLTYITVIRVAGRQLGMLRLRNPWSGTNEWNGPWSDQSREWRAVSEHEKQQLGLVFAADGEFWMEYNDFRANFTRVELCNLSPDNLDENVERSWYAQLFEGAWVSGQTAGGCRNNIESFAQNPQYIVNLSDPDENDDDDSCTVIVALMQKNRRDAKKYRMGSSELTIGFAIYSLRDGSYRLRDPVALSPRFQGAPLLSTDFFRYNASVARSPTYINLREVTSRFKLPPGPYVVIPSTFDPDEEGEFILRVWTEAPSTTGLPAGITPGAHHVLPRPGEENGGIGDNEIGDREGRGDEDEEDERPKQPSYPPYPSQPVGPQPSYPGQPVGPQPPYPGQPVGPQPTYPPYPSPGDGIKYPPLPQEPEIIKRRAPPPPPGPSIDITIGEVAGIISIIFTVLAFCWSTYSRMSSNQTYPYRSGYGEAPFGQRMTTLQMSAPHESARRSPIEDPYQQPTQPLKVEKSPADFVGTGSRSPSPRRIR